MLGDLLSFLVFFRLFVNIQGFPTTTFRRTRSVGTRLTRRIDPRIPDTPKS